MQRPYAVFVLIALFAAPAAAQWNSPTLERIAGSGVFRVGFVPDAPPMSFLDDNGEAVGYSIELCRHVAASMRDYLGLDSLDIEFVPLVSMEDRLSAVEDGDVDIECGATTVTLSRRERVDFTLMTYITGGSVVSRTRAPVQTMEGIDGRSIAVVGGTTTESSLRDYLETNDFDVEIVATRTHDEGMQALRNGDVDAYASDRTMLVGQVFSSANASDYVLSRNVFSFEPYALVLRRGDTNFRLAADRALASLYRTARIRRIHHNWFGRYGEPMAPIVEAMYEFQAVGE